MEESLWKIVGISSSIFFLYYLYGLYKKYHSWYNSLFWVVKIFVPNPREDNEIKALLGIAVFLIIIAIVLDIYG